MALLYLIRHGHASTTCEPSDWNSRLGELGRTQAEARAEQIAGRNLERLALLSSPLQRARETTAALEHRWNAVALVDARVGEIQSPGVPPEQRKDWLRDILLRRWSELGQPHDRWRSDVLQALLRIREDTIVFSHSVAINVAVEFALGDDRVTPFLPANCSCTVMDAQDGRLRMLELGNEDASGRILGHSKGG